jgi:hypothetical protein
MILFTLIINADASPQDEMLDSFLHRIIVLRTTDLAKTQWTLVEVLIGRRIK